MVHSRLLLFNVQWFNVLASCRFFFLKNCRTIEILYSTITTELSLHDYQILLVEKVYTLWLNPNTWIGKLTRYPHIAYTDIVLNGYVATYNYVRQPWILTTHKTFDGSVLNGISSTSWHTWIPTNLEVVYIAYPKIWP